MTDREQELANDPNILRLTKGHEAVWVDKGSAAETLWRSKGFGLESETTTAAERKAEAAAHAPHAPAADEKLDSRGVVAEADRSKKGR